MTEVNTFQNEKQSTKSQMNKDYKPQSPGWKSYVSPIHEPQRCPYQTLVYILFPSCEANTTMWLSGCNGGPEAKLTRCCRNNINTVIINSEATKLWIKTGRGLSVLTQTNIAGCRLVIKPCLFLFLFFSEKDFQVKIIQSGSLDQQRRKSSDCWTCETVRDWITAACFSTGEAWYCNTFKHTCTHDDDDDEHFDHFTVCSSIIFF